MSEQSQQPPNTIHDLIQDLDLTLPLHEVIGDPALLEQPIEFEPQELQRLDALAQAYLEGLAERGMIPDLPPMDMDLTLFEREYRSSRTEQDVDFGR